MMITAPRPASAPSLVPARLATDAELVRRVREGDERAFEAIYERHQEALHRYCHSIVRQREDAEEAYQATMLAAFRSLSEPDAQDVQLRPWLYRIAHNACVSVLRRRPAEPHAPLSGLEVAPGRVEERSEVAADLRQLRQDLDQLPDGQRTALVMRELGGLGHEEIGRALGEGPAVVKQLIYNARLALHDLAAGRDMACDRVRRTLSDGDRRILRSRSLRAHVRACDACRRWEEGRRLRPARLAALAPFLPAAALHEVLRAAFGTAGASGAGAGALGTVGAGVVAATAAGAGAGGVGASLAAKVAIIGTTAIIGGGTATIPALEQPAGGPLAAIALLPDAAHAALTTPATPVGGAEGIAVRGTARADLGPGRSDGAGRSEQPLDGGGAGEGGAGEASHGGAGGGEQAWDVASAGTGAGAAEDGGGLDVVMERDDDDEPEGRDGPQGPPAANGSGAPGQGAGAGQGNGTGASGADPGSQGASGQAGPPAAAPAASGSGTDGPAKPEQAAEDEGATPAPAGTPGANGAAQVTTAPSSQAATAAQAAAAANAPQAAGREENERVAEVVPTPAEPAEAKVGKPAEPGSRPSEPAGKPAEAGTAPGASPQTAAATGAAKGSGKVE